MKAIIYARVAHKPEMENIVRVILYARVSTENQRDNNVSLDDQIKAMRRYAADRGWFIYSEVKESWSGFEYDREYLDGIREEAKGHAFDVLLVLRTDRFARDEAVFLLLERFFKKHGIRLFSVEDGEFTPGVINRYLAAINRARAQDEADTFKKRSHEARHAYMQAGIPPGQGQAVYGYNKDGKKRETRYIVNRSEADIVRLIFDMFVNERLSVKEIAVQLSTMGIPCPSIMKGAKRSLTGKWHDTMIRRLLGNTAYIGRLTVYTTKMVEGKQVKTGADEHYTIPVPTIIDKKIFDQAQYILSHKSVNDRARKHRTYILAGMLSCSCGKLMCGGSILARRKLLPGVRYNFFYRCSARNRILDRPACGNRAFSAIDIEHTVWEFVERLIRDPKTTLALYQKDQEAKDALLSHVQERIAAIDELLGENTAELRRLQKMYQRGGCDDQYFDAEKKRIEDEAGAILRERSKAQRLLDRNKNTIAQLAELEEIGEEVRNNILGSSDQKKRRIYERLRLHITAEHSTSRDRHVVIEVLGHKERVRVKTSSAPS
jgi:site-specific DNA recombinase